MNSLQKFKFFKIRSVVYKVHRSQKNEESVIIYYLPMMPILHDRLLISVFLPVLNLSVPIIKLFCFYFQINFMIAASKNTEINKQFVVMFWHNQRKSGSVSYVIIWMIVDEGSERLREPFWYCCA